MFIVTFLYILEVLLLVFFTLILLFLLQSFVTLFFIKVPFVPVPKAILSRIVKTLDLSASSADAPKRRKGDSVLYDLGCGDGRVLFAAAKNYPTIKAIGFERAWLPLFWARTKKIFNPGKKNIKIYGKDFFKQDMSGASHVFLYLIPEIMDKLLPKLEKELSSGTRLVACDFPFKNKKETEIIDLGRKENQLGKRLYVYEF